MSSQTGPPLQKVKDSIAPRVFIPAAAIILVFVVGAMFIGESADTSMTNLRNWISDKLGWYYIFAVVAFIAVSFGIGLSRFGKMRLGPPDSKPEFSTGSWFAMLFSAGMGIGLVFYGAYEPLEHFVTPPFASKSGNQEAANDAMLVTFMHWGIHPWAIYVVLGLALAFAVHRKGKPLSLRWVLEPIFGDRVKGALGDLIDVTAVVATMFGVATSLGLGVTQINGGLHTLAPSVFSDDSTPVQVVCIILITSIALWSVVSGVKRGMKWLSNINMIVAAVVLLVVLIAGPTLFIFREFFTSTGYYLQNLFSATFNAGSFPSGGYDDAAGFQSAWTIFYWGWWISWAPFVSVFIARISRGRTIREFCLGVLLVPTVLSFFWFTVMGGTSLLEEMKHMEDGQFTLGGLLEADAETGEPVPSETLSMFNLIDSLGLNSGFALVLAGLTVLLVVTFFVTSSDSGSLVIDMLSSGGNTEPPKTSRVFWAILEGVVAAGLLLVGGIEALKNMAIILALPFSMILLLTCVAIWKALAREYDDITRTGAPPKVVAEQSSAPPS